MTVSGSIERVASAYAKLQTKHRLPSVRSEKRWIAGLLSMEKAEVFSVLGRFGPADGWAIRIGSKSDALLGADAFATETDERPILEGEFISADGRGLSVFSNGRGGWNLVEIGPSGSEKQAAVFGVEKASTQEASPFVLQRTSLLGDPRHTLHYPEFGRGVTFEYDVLWVTTNDRGMVRKAALLASITRAGNTNDADI